jgi:hypothetical protein
MVVVLGSKALDKLACSKVLGMLVCNRVLDNTVVLGNNCRNHSSGYS